MDRGLNQFDFGTKGPLLWLSIDRYLLYLNGKAVMEHFADIWDYCQLGIRA